MYNHLTPLLQLEKKRATMKSRGSLNAEPHYSEPRQPGPRSRAISSLSSGHRPRELTEGIYHPAPSIAQPGPSAARKSC